MGAASYRYDGRGNLLVITSGLNITNYNYDYANRLTQAVLPAGGGTYNYTYDADGRRVSQTGSGSTTSYLWDERGLGNVALEVNGANITNYLLGEGNLLSQNRAGTLSDYLPDGNGNIRALTGGTGSISDQYNYDAYGNTTHTSGTTTNPYQYKGQQYDPATALYNLRARYYTPASGRFLSRDTASLDYQNPVELNRYGYTAEDPINRADPSGYELVEYSLIASGVTVKDLKEADEETQDMRNLLAGDVYSFAAVELKQTVQSMWPELWGDEECRPNATNGIPLVIAYSEIGVLPLPEEPGEPIMFFPVVAANGIYCKALKEKVEAYVIGVLHGTFTDSDRDYGFPPLVPGLHAEVALYLRYRDYIPQASNEGVGTMWAIGVSRRLCEDDRGQGFSCSLFFQKGLSLMYQPFPPFTTMAIAEPYLGQERK